MGGWDLDQAAKKALSLRGILGGAVDVRITGRHMSVTNAMKEYAAEKSQRLERYYDQIQDVEIVIDNEGDRRLVEMIIHARRGGRFVGHTEHEDAYAAVDLLIDKMERQLTKQKEKLKLRKRSGDSGRVGSELAAAEAAKASVDEEEEETYQDVVDRTEM